MCLKMKTEETKYNLLQPETKSDSEIAKDIQDITDEIFETISSLSK